MNDSLDFSGTVTSLEVSSLLLPVIIWMFVGCEVVKSYELLQSVLCKQKLITPLPPYSMTHMQRCPSSTIWGAVGELPLIMFEIRLHCFHTVEMQRSKRTAREGACFRNIYYPIKIGTSESSNYLQPVSGMMNGMMGLFSPTCISLWCAGGLHPSTLSEPPPSSD